MANEVLVHKQIMQRGRAAPLVHNVIQPAAAHELKHLMVSVNHEHRRRSHAATTCGTWILWYRLHAPIEVPTIERLSLLLPSSQTDSFVASFSFWHVLTDCSHLLLFSLCGMVRSCRFMFLLQVFPSSLFLWHVMIFSLLLSQHVSSSMSASSK